MFLVFSHDARQLGDKVGRAGAADGLPQLPGARERVVGVCLSSAFPLLVAESRIREASYSAELAKFHSEHERFA